MNSAVELYQLLGLFATIVIAIWIGAVRFISQLANHEARITNNEDNDSRFFDSFAKIDDKLEYIKDELVKQRTLEEERNK